MMARRKRLRRFVALTAAGALAIGGLWLQAGAANFSPWSQAIPLAEINTALSVEGCPFEARSGLSLYFASNQAGGYGGLDLYVSHRPHSDASWGPPTNLGPGVNTSSNEQCPLLLNSAKELIFVSDRSGGLGALDIWTAQRDDHRDDLGWHSPTNVGTVNTPQAEFGPGAFETEDGSTVLFFNSNRPGGAGGHDLYQSARATGEVFGAPARVSELSTAFEEQFAALRRDGRELFFSSDRPGTEGMLDLWHATRSSAAAPWSPPVNLGAAVNSSLSEGRSAISWDGETLTFHTNRDRSVDLYESTRDRQMGVSD